MAKSLFPSIGGAIIISIIAGFLTSSIPVGLCIGIIAFFLILAIFSFSSQSQYMKAFGLVLGIIVSLNAPTLKFIAKITGFEIQYNMENSWMDEITLGIVGAFGIILLFIESRNNPSKKAKIIDSEDAEIDQSGRGTKSADIGNSKGAKIKQ